MNKNSNLYQILYSAIMVVLVGTVLAFVYMALKPRQDDNIANDKRKQILSAIHIPATADQQLKNIYHKYITAEMLVDDHGNVVDSTANVAFDIDMKSNVKATHRKLPVLVSKLDDGSTKYIIPVYGAGLWGPIWGYIAVDADGKTIYGANFSHESETPGLGARITDDPAFANAFNGKTTLVYAGQDECTLPFTHGYDGANTVEPTPYDFYGHRGIGTAEMAWAIRRGRPHRCSGEYGLHCLEVLAGMEESARTGRAVEIASRFAMEPLTPGYYSSMGGMRGDAERSLMD